MSKLSPTTRPAKTTPERLRRVEGRHNSLVKEMRRAFSRAELTESGSFAIEGLRMVEEAIRSGLRFDAVFFSESAENQAQKLMPQLGAHVETAVLPDKLFARSSGEAAGGASPASGKIGASRGHLFAQRRAPARGKPCHSHCNLSGRRRRRRAARFAVKGRRDRRHPARAAS